MIANASERSTNTTTRSGPSTGGPVYRACAKPATASSPGTPSEVISSIPSHIPTMVYKHLPGWSYARRLSAPIPACIRRKEVLHAVTIALPRLRTLDAVRFGHGDPAIQSVVTMLSRICIYICTLQLVALLAASLYKHLQLPYLGSITAPASAREGQYPGHILLYERLQERDACANHSAV
jgi:hypothetical protein